MKALFFAAFVIFAATVVKAEPLINGLQGSGGEQDPVLIGTADDLRVLSAVIMNGAAGDNVTKNAYFKMTNDIDFESDSMLYDFDNDGTKESNFIPIGGRSGEKTASDWHNFQGIFDGDGHIISGLRVLYGNVNYVGLFGQSYGGSIYRVGIEDGEFSGNGSVASLCGLATGGEYGFPGTTIKECFARNVDIRGSYWSVGGLIGATYTDAVVENCYAAQANVSGTDFVGGFCGNNNGNATIKNSYFFGFVESRSGTLGNYGGFAGQAKTDAENNHVIVNVTNCYYNDDWKISDSVLTADFAKAGSPKNEDFMTSIGFVDSLNLGQTAIWQANCDGEGTPSLYWECEQEVANEANINTESGLKIYPNPVTDGVLNIISRESREYSIFDFTGKLLKRGQIASGSTAINLKGLKAGIYVLQAGGEKSGETGYENIKIVVK